MQTIGGNAFCVVSDGAKFDLRYARAAFAALAGYALLGRLEWRMFEPFPGNYVWNLSANLALYTGLPRTSGCKPADQIKEYFQSGLSK